MITLTLAETQPPETQPESRNLIAQGETINLKGIRRDGNTQYRPAIDKPHVDRLVTRLEAGEALPNLKAVKDPDGVIWLFDGYHRDVAYTISGIEEAKFDLYEGTVEDARWFAMSENASHGLPRDAKTIEMVVKAALLHPKSKGMSVRAIARHCGNISPTTVSKYRDELVDAGLLESTDETTVSRGGQTYTMKKGSTRTKAGKAPAQALNDDEIIDLLLNNPANCTAKITTRHICQVFATIGWVDPPESPTSGMPNAFVVSNATFGAPFPLSFNGISDALKFWKAEGLHLKEQVFARQLQPSIYPQGTRVRVLKSDDHPSIVGKLATVGEPWRTKEKRGQLALAVDEYGERLFPALPTDVEPLTAAELAAEGVVEAEPPAEVEAVAVDTGALADDEYQQSKFQVGDRIRGQIYTDSGDRGEWVEGTVKTLGSKYLRIEIEGTGDAPIFADTAVIVTDDAPPITKHELLSGSGTKDPSKDERYTPSYLWEPGLVMFGRSSEDGFDLDPFSNSLENPNIPSKEHWTLETDKTEPTLERSWAYPDGEPREIIWVQPPYSKSGPCVHKTVAEYLDGKVKNVLMLVKTDNRTRWYNEAMSNCALALLVNHSVSFLVNGKQEGGSFFPSTLFYFGQLNNKFDLCYKHLGFIVTVFKPRGRNPNLEVDFTSVQIPTPIEE